MKLVLLVLVMSFVLNRIFSRLIFITTSLFEYSSGTVHIFFAVLNWVVALIHLASFVVLLGSLFCLGKEFVSWCLS